MKKILIIIAVCLIFCIGYQIGSLDRKVVPFMHTDTIYTVDTIRYYVPKPIQTKLVKCDTIILPVVECTTDTANASVCANMGANQGDSVAVEIPITQKVYEDSLYKAYISGFRPSLDSIQIYKQTREITVVKKNKKLNYGFFGGVGYDLINNQPALTVGFGINYNL